MQYEEFYWDNYSKPQVQAMAEFMGHLIRMAEATDEDESIQLQRHGAFAAEPIGTHYAEVMVDTLRVMFEREAPPTAACLAFAGELMKRESVVGNGDALDALRAVKLEDRGYHWYQLARRLLQHDSENVRATAEDYFFPDPNYYDK